jgi:hypothetical protein
MQAGSEFSCRGLRDEVILFGVSILFGQSSIH